MLAALCAALAVALLCQSDAVVIQKRLAEGARGTLLPFNRMWLLALSVGAVLWAVGLKYLDWLAITAVVIGTIGYLVHGHQRRKLRLDRQKACAQGARTLASLLRTGLIPTAALESAAQDCSALQSAASVAQLGGDVGAELGRAAELDGQLGMRSIAAAWKVSERSGAPIADVLTLVSDNLRQQRQLDALIEAELAAARTSGHIMAALPFLAIGLGLAVGVNTAEFLITDSLGRLLLLAGVTLTAVGVVWIDRLSAQERLA